MITRSKSDFKSPHLGESMAMNSSGSTLRLLLMGLFLALGMLSQGCGAGEKACKDDSICSKFQICIGGVCKPGCRKDGQCPPGQRCIEQKCSDKVCISGEQKPCFDGPETAINQGVCHSGRKLCAADGKSWSACQGQRVPAKEICDTEDNDCDGKTDEDKDGKPLDCKCKPGAQRKCYTGPPGTVQYGQCKMGIQYCTELRRWGTCRGEVHPTQEICDTIDNNCDGKIDEKLDCTCKSGEKPRSCYGGPFFTLGPGKVPCKAGEQACIKQGSTHRWGKCEGQVLPQNEEIKPCNNVDDDCDGIIDNKTGQNTPLKRTCYEGKALTDGNAHCKAGTQTCLSGKWDLCKDQALPREEICNGKDDDCDGKVDNKVVPVFCYPHPKGCKEKTKGNYSCLGRCRPGIKRCVNGKRETKCEKAEGPLAQEDCTNQIDDDCNGEIDDASQCSCKTGDTRPCYTGTKGTQGIGPCKAGTQKCVSSRWGTCENQITPTTETCNNKDDNCDGKVDNLDKACVVSSQKGVCRTGQMRCVNQKPICESNAQATTEVCDGKDNDCDGIVDNINKNALSCTIPNQKGVCKQGIWKCEQQKATCAAIQKASPEDCNGLDDDCDGKIDNPSGQATQLSRPCYSLNTQGCTLQKGGSYNCIQPCRSGKQVCQQGIWSRCTGELLPIAESCDGKDNDCDGKVDNTPNTAKPLERACYPKPHLPNRGVCSPGAALCQNAKWGSCQGAVTASAEVCDGKDNDCDGQTDEDLPNLGKACQATHLPPACRNGKTACIKGKIVCSTQGIAEICDGKDNDCDGKVDNQPGKTDKIFQPCYPSGTKGCTSSGSKFTCAGVCKVGSSFCQGGKWGTCISPVVPSTESCNGSDDDCDGLVDEDQDIQKAGATCPIAGQKGECQKGKLSCQNSKLTCVPEPRKSEICNGKDDDCDGIIDEGLSAACLTAYPTALGKDTSSIRIQNIGNVPHLAYISNDMLFVMNLNTHKNLKRTVNLSAHRIANWSIRFHVSGKYLLVFAITKVIFVEMQSDGPVQKQVITFKPGTSPFAKNFIDLAFDTDPKTRTVFLLQGIYDGFNKIEETKLWTITAPEKAWNFTSPAPQVFKGNIFAKILPTRGSTKASPGKFFLFGAYLQTIGRTQIISGIYDRSTKQLSTLKYQTITGTPEVTAGKNILPFSKFDTKTELSLVNLNLQSHTNFKNFTDKPSGFSSHADRLSMDHNDMRLLYGLYKSPYLCLIPLTNTAQFQCTKKAHPKTSFIISGSGSIIGVALSPNGKVGAYVFDAVSSQISGSPKTALVIIRWP